MPGMRIQRIRNGSLSSHLTTFGSRPGRFCLMTRPPIAAVFLVSSSSQPHIVSADAE